MKPNPDGRAAASQGPEYPDADSAGVADSTSRAATKTRTPARPTTKPREVARSRRGRERDAEGPGERRERRDLGLQGAIKVHERLPQHAAGVARGELVCRRLGHQAREQLAHQIGLGEAARVVRDGIGR